MATVEEILEAARMRKAQAIIDRARERKIEAEKSAAIRGPIEQQRLLENQAQAIKTAITQQAVASAPVKMPPHMVANIGVLQTDPSTIGGIVKAGTEGGAVTLTPAGQQIPTNLEAALAAGGKEIVAGNQRLVIDPGVTGKALATRSEFPSIAEHWRALKAAKGPRENAASALGFLGNVVEAPMRAMTTVLNYADAARAGEKPDMSQAPGDVLRGLTGESGTTVSEGGMTTKRDGGFGDLARARSRRLIEDNPDAALSDLLDPLHAMINPQLHMAEKLIPTGMKHLAPSGLIPYALSLAISRATGLASGVDPEFVEQGSMTRLLNADTKLRDLDDGDFETLGLGLSLVFDPLNLFPVEKAAAGAAKTIGGATAKAGAKIAATGPTAAKAVGAIDDAIDAARWGLHKVNQLPSRITSPGKVAGHFESMARAEGARAADAIAVGEQAKTAFKEALRRSGAESSSRANEALGALQEFSDTAKSTDAPTIRALIEGGDAAVPRLQMASPEDVLERLRENPDGVSRLPINLRARVEGALSGQVEPDVLLPHYTDIGDATGVDVFAYHPFADAGGDAARQLDAAKKLYLGVERRYAEGARAAGMNIPLRQDDLRMPHVRMSDTGGAIADVVPKSQRLRVERMSGADPSYNPMARRTMRDVDDMTNVLDDVIDVLDEVDRVKSTKHIDPDARPPPESFLTEGQLDDLRVFGDPERLARLPHSERVALADRVADSVADYNAWADEAAKTTTVSPLIPDEGKLLDSIVTRSRRSTKEPLRSKEVRDQIRALITNQGGDEIADAGLDTISLGQERLARRGERARFIEDPLQASASYVDAMGQKIRGARFSQLLRSARVGDRPLIGSLADAIVNPMFGRPDEALVAKFFYADGRPRTPMFTGKSLHVDIKKYLNDRDLHYITADEARGLPGLAGSVVPRGVFEDVLAVAERIKPVGIARLFKIIKGMHSFWVPIVLNTPGFHVRNFVYGMFQSWLAMKSGIARRKTWEDAHLVARFASGDRAVDNSVITLSNGVKVDAATLASEAKKLGVYEGGRAFDLGRRARTGMAYRDEVGRRAVQSLSPFNERGMIPRALGGGKVFDRVVSGGLGGLAAGKASTKVGAENVQRVAVFLDALGKGKTPIEASDHVVKYMFDYTGSSLTRAERQLRDLAPFYQWLRYSTEQAITSVVSDPGKYGVIDRTWRLYESLGDNENNFDPRETPAHVYQAGAVMDPLAKQGPEGMHHIVYERPGAQLQMVAPLLHGDVIGALGNVLSAGAGPGPRALLEIPTGKYAQGGFRQEISPGFDPNADRPSRGMVLDVIEAAARMPAEDLAGYLARTVGGTPGTLYEVAAREIEPQMQSGSTRRSGDDVVARYWAIFVSRLGGPRYITTLPRDQQRALVSQFQEALQDAATRGRVRAQKEATPAPLVEAIGGIE